MEGQLDSAPNPSAMSRSNTRNRPGATSVQVVYQIKNDYLFLVRRKHSHIVAAGVVALVFSLFGDEVRAESSSPAALRAEIDARYQGIDWVDGATLSRWMSEEGRELVLLDVRQPREYAVSHLRGARQVDPGRRDVSGLELPSGATIVVYCSVGYRSAALAQRLEAAGYQHIYNLVGGLFQWANEDRPVFRSGRRVQQVHPYDEEWGRLLDEERRAPL